MTIVRVGTNKKYAEGWEAAFGGKRKKKAKTATSKKATSVKAKAKKSSKSTKKQAKK